MEFTINIILLLISFAFVIWGGNKFVNCSVLIAKKLKIPSVIIGATLVSIGTTLPELLVTILSSSSGKAELSIGNALGSIIFNSCIIGGILILFLKSKTQKIMPLFLISSICLFAIMCVNGKIELFEAVILIFLFICFVYINIKNSKNLENSNATPQQTQAKMLPTILLLIFSAILTAVGANTLVNSASNLSRALGVSETIIGLTIVGLGTSLPELVTSIIAITKNETDLGLGNIIGSNLINLLLLIGMSGIITSPLKISEQSLHLGLPFVLVSSIFLCLPILIFSKTKKWQSLLLFATFIINYILLFLQTFA